MSEPALSKVFRADIDPDQLGAGFVIIVQVTLSQTSDNALDLFSEAVKRIPEAQVCFMLAGQFDYLLVIRTSDISHYRNVRGDRIGKLPGVQQTNSFVAMERVKDNTTIPLML